MPHVEADQDLGRLKKKNGLLGSNTILLRVNTFNDVFLREIELHMGFIEKKRLECFAKQDPGRARESS